MPTSFSALKKNRSKELDKLNDQLQKMNSGGQKGDDDYWKLEVDKAGNGFAILRFLPAPQGEDEPFIRMWDHGFQGPGGWYIENSLTTLQQDDPVTEHNSKLWNSGVESDKKIARERKRRLAFHANVYVVKDTANPDNEGKVFKYKFGKRIFDKLNDLMNPQFEDEERVNPFDFWEGADFKLKARMVEGYRNYDKSEFSESGPITLPDGTPMTDEQMEEIWNQQFSLKDIIAPDKFKTYEELQKKFFKVIGAEGSQPSDTAEDNDVIDYTPNFKEKAADEGQTQESDLNLDDEDDELAFFSNLSNKD